MKKRSLLFVHITTHFKEMIRVAKVMKASGKHEPYIFFDALYEGVENDIEECKAANINFIADIDDGFKIEKKVKQNTIDKIYYQTNKMLPQSAKHTYDKFKKNYSFVRNKGSELSGFLYQTISVWALKFPTISKIIKKGGRRLLPIVRLGRRCISTVNQQINNFWYTKIEAGTLKFYRLIKKITRVGSKIFIASSIKFINRVFHYMHRKSPFFIKRMLASVLKRKIAVHSALYLYKKISQRYPKSMPAISRAAFTYLEKIPLLIKHYKIEFMVFPEHNLFYFTQLFVYHGRRLNIPSIIVPFTIANTLEWSEAFYKEPSRSLNYVYNKIASLMFPHWIHFYKNHHIILPLELIFFHEMLKITPAKPWLLNSGDIDFLAVESDAMKDYYIAAGIEADKLKATGALYNDELFYQLQHAKQQRLNLFKTLGFTDDKPIMLCALPPNQLAGRNELVEFDSYEEIVTCIINEMCKYADKYNIVINLHPRITRKSVDFILDYPVKISSANISQLVPLSSLYIASCSATIRMAITCAIPVINYDLYHYEYDDYTGIKGVLTIADKKDFIESLRTLATDEHYYQSLKKEQYEYASLWGVLDGHSGEKLLKEIDKLFPTETKLADYA